MMTTKNLVAITILLAACCCCCNGFVIPKTTTTTPTSRSSSSSILHMSRVGTAIRRVRDSLTNRERSREDLKIGIAGFYDRSSKLWEDVWGEVRFSFSFTIVKNLMDYTVGYASHTLSLSLSLSRPLAV